MKVGADFVIARRAFGVDWSPVHYWIAPFPIFRMWRSSAEHVVFVVTMLALALPFICMGVSLCLQRTRAAGLPLWMVALFFVPGLNLIYFVLLATLPTAPERPPDGARPLDGRAAAERPWPSAVLALAVTVPPFLLAGIAGARGLGQYGWSLFVGLPFALGVAAAVVHGWRAPKPLRGCIGVASAAVLLLGVALIAIAVEGVVCILIAAPFAFFLASLGAVVGYFIQERRSGTALVPVALALCVPALMGFEHAVPPVAPLLRCSASIEVDAPPERVFDAAVRLGELPRPDDWLSRAGISYLVRADIDGEGAGAVRRAIFSTGPSLQRIEVWDAPRRLRFTVIEQPDPLRETSPWGEIAAPHVRGYLAVEAGEFLLTPLPGGRTRLEGATSYRHRIFPVGYWRLWSDWILRRTQRRVLDHVKRRAESAAGAPRPRG